MSAPQHEFSANMAAGPVQATDIVTDPDDDFDQAFADAHSHKKPQRFSAQNNADLNDLIFEIEKAEIRWANKHRVNLSSVRKRLATSRDKHELTAWQLWNMCPEGKQLWAEHKSSAPIYVPKNPNMPQRYQQLARRTVTMRDLYNLEVERVGEEVLLARLKAAMADAEIKRATGLSQDGRHAYVQEQVSDIEACMARMAQYAQVGSFLVFASAHPHDHDLQNIKVSHNAVRFVSRQRIMNPHELVVKMGNYLKGGVEALQPGIPETRASAQEEVRDGSKKENCKQELLQRFNETYQEIHGSDARVYQRVPWKGLLQTGIHLVWDQVAASKLTEKEIKADGKTNAQAEAVYEAFRLRHIKFEMIPGFKTTNKRKSDAPDPDHQKKRRTATGAASEAVPAVPSAPAVQEAPAEVPAEVPSGDESSGDQQSEVRGVPDELIDDFLASLEQQLETAAGGPVGEGLMVGSEGGEGAVVVDTEVRFEAEVGAEARRQGEAAVAEEGAVMYEGEGTMAGSEGGEGALVVDTEVRVEAEVGAEARRQVTGREAAVVEEEAVMDEGGPRRSARRAV
ncbi:hypothetical protein B9479_007479 [Cryptococcus floricola]|uniref:Uncharacterized protein n=1 Tax=Cryptococcus floricola TaxID=2591691 RepID=A0A5D3AMP5_9TREE|nr:hypothetical protein B9479_007479 [Cryptococcus floricola]